MSLDAETRSPLRLASAATAPAPFSADLRELMRRFQGRPVRLEELLHATQGRGYHLVLLLVSLPFVGPIPLPGFSIPFGLLVTLLGARLALGREAWFPRVLLRRELPARSVARWLQAVSRIMRGVEILIRPRWDFVPHHAVFGRVAGVLIALSGLMLMLPFPLPFSNSLPAWTVILLSAGALGRDGVFFFVGCGSFALSVAFFTFVAVGGVAAIEQLQRLFLR